MMEEIESANKVAVESGHRVLTLLAQHKQQPHDQLLCKNLISQTDDSLLKFKRVVSLLGNRFFVARARRFNHLSSPNLPENLFTQTSHSSPDPSAKLTSETDPKSENILHLIPTMFDDNSGMETSLSVKPPSVEAPHQKMHFWNQQQQKIKYQAHMYSRTNSSSGLSLKFDWLSNSTQTMTSNRSFISSLSMDGSLGNLGGNSFQVTGLPKPYDQNPQQVIRRRCTFKGENGSLKCITNGKCHCSKRRKLRVKRSIKVPAISNKIADIPPDEYSWRKGYYKCSSMRACPARKHVERCTKEPSMLIVTYEGDHKHARFTSSAHT